MPQPPTCVVDGCEHPPGKRRGYCTGHYARITKHGDPMVDVPLRRRRRTPEPCSVRGCEVDARSGGMCSTHYGRTKTRGYPLPAFRAPMVPCLAPDCDEWVSPATELCRPHRARLRRTGTVNPRPLVNGGACSVPECRGVAVNNGKCEPHYYLLGPADRAARRRVVRSNAQSGRRARLKGAQAERGLSWRSLWADGQRLCYLCGLECDPHDALGPRNLGPRYPSLDHIVPLSRGGQHSSRNVALACLDCNRRKSSRILAPGPAAA